MLRLSTELCQIRTQFLLRTITLWNAHYFQVKKRQQRVLMILESKNIPCEIIDITEPGKESDKEFMQQNSKPRGDQKYPLPPQIFSDEEYCGVRHSSLNFFICGLVTIFLPSWNLFEASYLPTIQQLSSLYRLEVPCLSQH